MSDKPTNPKDIVGTDKVPLHLWPGTASALGSMALMEGAMKYGRTNWRVAGVRYSIYMDAAMRHMQKAFEGEDDDPDSGLPHEAHALACIAIIVDARYAGTLVDDRAYPGGFAVALEEMTPHVADIRERYKDRDPKHYTINDKEDS